MINLFYGTDKNYLDITIISCINCIKNNILYIPASDGDRFNIFKNDPDPGVYKNIKIIINNQEKIYPHGEEINIIINNTIGIYILEKILHDFNNKKIFLSQNINLLSNGNLEKNKEILTYIDNESKIFSKDNSLENLLLIKDLLVKENYNTIISDKLDIIPNNVNLIFLKNYDNIDLFKDFILINKGFYIVFKKFQKNNLETILKDWDNTEFFKKNISNITNDTCALCIYGQLRTFEYCYPFLKYYILDCIPNLNIFALIDGNENDIMIIKNKIPNLRFCNTIQNYYNENEEYKKLEGKLNDIFKNSKSIYENPHKHYFTCIMWFRRWLINNIKNNWEFENKIRHKYCIGYRFDIVYTGSPNLEICSPSKIVSHCDLSYYGLSNDIDIMVELGLNFNKIDSISKEHAWEFASETKLLQYQKLRNLILIPQIELVKFVRFDISKLKQHTNHKNNFVSILN